ncbi:hypothetical protein TNCV_1413171 [Trichonephila clavipes]|nr:hypothetical protein TNCV_1413171 [Trichonephila clavipes]
MKYKTQIAVLPVRRSATVRLSSRPMIIRGRLAQFSFAESSSTLQHRCIDTERNQHECHNDFRKLALDIESGCQTVKFTDLMIMLSIRDARKIDIHIERRNNVAYGSRRTQSAIVVKNRFWPLHTTEVWGTTIRH